MLFLPPIISIRDTRDTESGRGKAISGFIIFFLPFLLLMVLRWIWVINDDIATALINVVFAALFGNVVAFLIVYEKRLVGLESEQKWLRIILMTNITALFVALSMGYYWAPDR
jgi:amino acid permease